MKWPDRIGLWWIPLVLIVTPLAGMMPAHRDLIDFFAPMRFLTAEMISSGVGPWINLANGCGEAWFANPETAVLYPPAWLHLILPGPWALTAEIALHLALFSLGMGLIARQLGAGRWGRMLVEIASWSSGPVLVTVGVLNNLETMTWLPWMVLSVRQRGRVSMAYLAVATALGWLGGEPQVWALGVVLSVTVARRRYQAILGVGLGVLIVLVQLIPFAIWVAEGDRGRAAEWLLRGAVAPADWSGVLVPAMSSEPGRMIYAESLFLGAPILVCALLGGWRRRWVLAIAAVFAVLATLPEIGAGRVFVFLTGGLVRYPSRFALLGLVLLLPFVGLGADRWLEGRGRWPATAISCLTLLACSLSDSLWVWWLAGGPAVLMMISAWATSQRYLRSASLVAGTAAMVIAGWPLLGLQPVAKVHASGPAWPEAVGEGRVYAPTPADDVMRWLASGLEARRLWPVGYLNLEDGLTLVRTDSPVANFRLASHVAVADEGPTRRWWLDGLAAEWMVLPAGKGLPERMQAVAERGGMRLLRNHDAWTVVSLTQHPPDPSRRPQGVGQVTSLEVVGNSCSAMIVAPDEAWLWVSMAPVRGWRWTLDGRQVQLEQGPGIVQSLEVERGSHFLEGRYQPPFHLFSTIVSGCGVLAALAGLAGLRKKVEGV